jgi:alkylation response protein AidB-like acyl-CoA dehydrogenase
MCPRRAAAAGLGRLEAALVFEAMAYGCPTTAAFLSIHNMAAWMLDSYGSPELKAQHLSACWRWTSSAPIA